MALFILLGAAALIPSLLLVVYFHRRDVHREPPAMLWATFGLGILIVIPVCLVAWPMDAFASSLGHPLAYGFASAFLSAAIPEELFKFAVVFFFAARRVQFDEPMDGVVYGATASLGFATLENVLYVSEGGLHVAILRAFLAVPGHAFMGAIMGYYIGRAKFTTGDRGALLARALWIPILLHGLYDTPLLAAGSFDDPAAAGCLVIALLPLAPAVVVVEAVWALRLVRRLRSEQLADGCPPAPEAVLPPPAPETEAAVAPASEAEERRRPGKVASWLMILFGGLAACVGGLVCLGMVLVEDPGSEELVTNVVAGLIFGLLPVLLGLLGFFRGIRRLNQG